MTSARVRFQLRQLGVVTAVVCIVAPIFNLLTVEASPGSALQGVVDGLLVSVVIGSYVEFVYEGVLRARLRRWSFLDWHLAYAIPVSGELLSQLELPMGVRAELLGDFQPRGQAKSLETYGLSAAA